MKTVNIIDYRLKSSILAKVLVSYTGSPSKAEMRDLLAKKMGYSAIPVASSFKQVRPGLAVGFLRANRAVRTPSRTEMKAGYRVMSSNILMDNGDKSLWEVKEGTTGRYLARHGQEDLSGLIEASLERRSDMPGLRHLAIAKAARSEVVAFVDAEGDLDHGFAVATADDQVKVLSFTRRVPMNVSYDNVVSISPVEISASVNKVVAGMLTPEQKRNEKAYYETLYSYAPQYMREILDSIDAGTEI